MSLRANNDASPAALARRRFGRNFKRVGKKLVDGRGTQA